jgi:hypothetical protein
MAELVFLGSRAFTKRTGGPPQSPHLRRGGGGVLSVWYPSSKMISVSFRRPWLGGCSVPSYGTGRVTMVCVLVLRLPLSYCKS